MSTTTTKSSKAVSSVSASPKHTAPVVVAEVPKTSNGHVLLLPRYEDTFDGKRIFTAIQEIRSNPLRPCILRIPHKQTKGKDEFVRFTNERFGGSEEETYAESSKRF